MNELLKEYKAYPKLAVNMLRVNKSADCEQVFYGKHKKQYYLVFFPPEGVERKREVVFYFHGGGWRLFSPREFAFVGVYLSRLGYVTVLPGYREVPKVRYPVPLDDAVQGMNAALRLLEERGVDVSRLVLTGASAGGHTASWIALHPELIARGACVGLCSMSGVTNFEYCTDRVLVNMLDALFPRHYDRMSANPYAYIKGGETFRVLCIHGSEDPVVNNGNSRSFVERFNERNGAGRAELFIQAQGATHHSDLIVEMFLSELQAYEVLTDWLGRL